MCAQAEVCACRFWANQPLGQRVHLVLTAAELAGQKAVPSAEPFETFLKASAQGLYMVLGERQGLARGNAGLFLY